jgi:hypothetical protein
VRNGGSTSWRSRSNALEIFLRDALLHAALKDGSGARAVAELGLLAPE